MAAPLLQEELLGLHLMHCCPCRCNSGWQTGRPAPVQSPGRQLPSTGQRALLQLGRQIGRSPRLLLHAEGTFHQILWLVLLKLESVSWLASCCKHGIH